MTNTKASERKIRARRRFISPSFIGLASLAAIGAYIIFLSEEVGEYVLEGLTLALVRVVPTSLPFMIISDLYMCYGQAENIKPLGALFRKIFGVSKIALRAFITGNICGFPIGVKAVSGLYSDGNLRKDEAERLSAYCSNPSCAFVIGAVGGGIFRDMKIGVILFVSVIASVLILGLLTRGKVGKYENSELINEQNFNIVGSVTSAASSCLTVCAFIALFSSIGGIVKKYCVFTPVKYAALALFEVTAGVEFFATEAPLSPLLALALSSFALSFGGISVMLQSAYFLQGTDLRLGKYFVLKLAQGAISALITAVLYTLLTI